VHHIPLLLASTMAASAADVRSILNLPVPNAAAKRKAAAQQTARRGEVSIARELSALIGPGGAPSLAVQRAPKPRLKAKPRLGGGVGVKWCAAVCLLYTKVESLCVLCVCIGRNASLRTRRVRMDSVYLTGSQRRAIQHKVSAVITILFTINPTYFRIFICQI
jgi:hypothetical protein